MSEAVTTQNPDYLTPAQAARVAPGRPGPETVWRWMTKGVKAPNGERVYLEHLRMGGRLLTTERWLIEFGKKLASKTPDPEPAAAEPPRAPRQPSDATRQRQIREAKESLGII